MLRLWNKINVKGECPICGEPEIYVYSQVKDSGVDPSLTSVTKISIELKAICAHCLNNFDLEHVDMENKDGNLRRFYYIDHNDERRFIAITDCEFVKEL